MIFSSSLSLVSLHEFRSYLQSFYTCFIRQCSGASPAEQLRTPCSHQKHEQCLTVAGLFPYGHTGAGVMWGMRWARACARVRAEVLCPGTFKSFAALRPSLPGSSPPGGFTAGPVPAHARLSRAHTKDRKLDLKDEPHHPGLSKPQGPRVYPARCPTVPRLAGHGAEEN